MTERESEILLKDTRSYTKESDYVLTATETRNAEKTLEENRELLGEMRDKKPKSLLQRLREIRVIKWVGKLIMNKWLWLLAGTSLAAYLVWYKFFKDQGITVECPENYKLDPATGECVYTGTGDKDDNQNVVTDDESEESTVKYIGCRAVYFKGCQDPAYGGEIRRLQNCLGIKQTGKFGTRTENALNAEINKNKVTSSEIDKICGLI